MEIHNGWPLRSSKDHERRKGVPPFAGGSRFTIVFFDPSKVKVYKFISNGISGSVCREATPHGNIWRPAPNHLTLFGRVPETEIQVVVVWWMRLTPTDSRQNICLTVSSLNVSRALSFDQQHTNRWSRFKLVHRVISPAWDNSLGINPLLLAYATIYTFYGAFAQLCSAFL